MEEIEKYKLEITELESNIKLKGKQIQKDKNTQFCELYQSFTNKRILKYKLEMIIGIFIKERQRNCQAKLNQAEQTIEKLRKKIQSLNEEIEELKKLLDNNQEEEEAKSVQTEEKNMKIRVETSKYETRTYQRPTGRSASQGIARVIRRSNEPVNVVVRTTKISYKRRNEG